MNMKIMNQWWKTQGFFRPKVHAKSSENVLNIKKKKRHQEFIKTNKTFLESFGSFNKQNEECHRTEQGKHLYL